MPRTPLSLQSLETIDESLLLKMRLCDIDFSLKKSNPVCKYIGQLNQELLAKGLRFKPTIWVSDEWFSPDGVAGFAIPFYLLSPRLVKLERKMTGLAEGEKPDEMMKLLRHETGHALDNAYHLRKRKKRQEVFGKTSKPYPQSYRPNIHSRAYVHHLGSGYAQAHPDEDWAETFALWMTPKSNWRKRYQRTPALAKLLLVDHIMNSIKTIKPKSMKGEATEDIALNKMTLADYYRKRQKQLKVRQESPVYKKAKIMVKTSGSLPAWRFLAANERYLTRIVAKKSLLPQYKVNELLKDFKMTCKHESLYLSTPNKRDNLRKMVRLLSHPQVIASKSRIQM